MATSLKILRMKIMLGADSFDVKPFYPNTRITRAAIYTIWTFDPSGDDYQLLFVGECGDEGVTLNEDSENYYHWLDRQISSLYISIEYLPTDTFSKKERKAIGDKLISTYRPLCNI